MLSLIEADRVKYKEDQMRRSQYHWLIQQTCLEDCGKIISKSKNQRWKLGEEVAIIISKGRAHPKRFSRKNL